MERSNNTGDDRGVVTLELVLAVPIMLALIIATVVMGNLFAVATQTEGLARDGARAAALGKPLPADTVVVGAPCPTPPDPTTFVEVRATKTVELRGIPFLPTVIPESVTREATMRCGG